MAYQDIARNQKLPQTSMETYEDNINWLHELLLDEDRIELIQKMEQLPNVLAMSTPRYKSGIHGPGNWPYQTVEIYF